MDQEGGQALQITGMDPLQVEEILEKNGNETSQMLTLVAMAVLVKTVKVILYLKTATRKYSLNTFPTNHPIN